MRLRLGIVAAFIILIAPAYADEVAKAAFAEAIEKSKEQSSIRWAFTMTYTDKSEEDARTYKLRYDPRLEKDAQWALLDRSLDELTKEERKTLKSMQKGDNSDDMLVYDKLKVDFDTAALLSSDAQSATYLVPLTDEEMPKNMHEAVRMEVTVNKAGAYVERVSLVSEKPFKPAPVAKLNKFLQVQEYAPTGEGVVLLRQSRSEASGKAMLKTFNSKTVTHFSDFERVDAPAVDGSGQ